MPDKPFYQATVARYMTAVLLVAGLSSTAYYTVRLMLRSQSESASVINAAGKRRFTSQQVAFFALRMAGAKDATTRAAYRAGLEAAFQRFNLNHDGLTRGDPTLKLSGTLSPAVHAFYFDEPVRLDAMVQSFRTMTADMLAVPERALRPDRPEIVHLVEFATGPLIVRLDEAVALYQAEAEQASGQLERMETVIFALTLLLLAAEVVFIFRPMTNALARMFETIERTVEKRTAELEASRATILEQQQQLVQATKMSALGEMAGGIAHEINTPLATIKLIASEIEDCASGANSDLAVVRELARKSEKTVDKIAGIIQSLRRFARDGSRDTFATASAIKIVRDTLELVVARFRDGKIRISVEGGEDVMLECRESEVSQVLLNLLSNAYDAVSGGGDAWVRVAVETESEHVVFRVTDSGNGIPEEAKQKLFQPFFTTKAIGKGTGLGLSISHGIARGHGGELLLDPRPGNTSFVLRLPKRHAAALSKAA